MRFTAVEVAEAHRLLREADASVAATRLQEV
jgi:hypothetical protein